MKKERQEQINLEKTLNLGKLCPIIGDWDFAYYVTENMLEFHKYPSYGRSPEMFLFVEHDEPPLMGAFGYKYTLKKMYLH